jgi:hypothetical protein
MACAHIIHKPKIPPKGGCAGLTRGHSALYRKPMRTSFQNCPRLSFLFYNLDFQARTKRDHTAYLQQKNPKQVFGLSTLQ